MDVCLGVYILIAAGALMMVVGFLGCCGAIQESPCMLGLVRILFDNPHIDPSFQFETLFDFSPFFLHCLNCLSMQQHSFYLNNLN